MSDRFSAVAARAQTLDGFAQTLGPISLAGRFKVQQSIADGIVYITQDGGPWLPIATGAGASATLASAYANGPAGNTIPMTDALGQVSFSSAITTGSIVGIVTTNAPATLTAAVTGLKIDMRSVGTAATPSTFDVPAILVEGAYSSVAKAAGSALVAIRSGYRNATALSVRVRNKQAAAGSIAVFGWDTTNYEGASAPSIITGDTHVVTIDASTNVTPGDKSMTGLRVVMPAGTGIIRGIDITSTQTASNLLEINANGSSATVSGAYITMASGVTNASRGVVVDWLSNGGALVGCIMVGSSAGITLSGTHIGAYLNMQTNVTAGSQAVYGGYVLLPASSSTNTTGIYIDTRATAGRFFAGSFSAATAPSGTFVGCEIDCQTLLSGNGEAVIGARYRITNSSNPATAGVIVDSTSTGSGSAGMRITLTPGSGNAAGVIVSMGSSISKTGITDGSAFLATLTGANACGLCVAATYNAGALAQNGVQMRREMTSSASFTESTSFLEVVNTSTFSGGTQTFSQSLAAFGNYATINGATHTWSGNLLLLTNAMSRSSGTATLTGALLRLTHAPTGTISTDTTSILVGTTIAKSGTTASLTSTATLTGAMTMLALTASGVTAGSQTVTGNNITMPSGTGIIRGISVTTTGNSNDNTDSAGIYILSGFARNGACGLRIDCAPTSAQTTFGPKALLIQTTNNNWVNGNFCEITNSSTGVNAPWNMFQLKVNPAGMSANAQMRTLWTEYSPTFTSGTYAIGTLNNAIYSAPVWNSAGTGTLGNTTMLVQFVPTRSAGTLNVTSSKVLQVDYSPSGTIGTDDTVGLYCKLTPASAATGACIEAVMANANAGGAAVKITHSGTNANQLVFASAADGTGAHIYGPTTAQFNIFAGAAAQASGTTAGRDLVLQASSAVAGSSSAGAAAGGSVYIRAKDAARLTSGNANGGDVSVNPGTGIGTGVAGGFLVGSTNATFMELYEMTAPAVASTNAARLFAVDNGAGKTQLVVQFQSGAAQVIATEP